jgi:hypothetical protein
MIKTSRPLLLATALFAIPAASALAQSSNAGGNYSTQPTTGSSSMTTQPHSAMNTAKPGATGKTVVPGSNSTVAGDTSATATAKAGSSGGSTQGK